MPTTATILEAVGSHIDANYATLTIGTNLFLAKMPDTPDFCVTVYEYQGQAPMETFGAAAFAIDKPSIQVVVRATRDDYPTARNLAQDLRILLASVRDTSINGLRVVRLVSNGSVLSLGTDDLDRPRIAFNLDCFVDA
jgi:hypothetical protein